MTSTRRPSERRPRTSAQATTVLPTPVSVPVMKTPRTKRPLGATRDLVGRCLVPPDRPRRDVRFAGEARCGVPAPPPPARAVDDFVGGPQLPLPPVGFLGLLHALQARAP